MAKHILVVDDSKLAADTKVMAIEAFGGNRYTCEAVYGGQECLDRLEKDPPVDLLVLDLEMPLNGIKVMHTIFNKDPRPKLKILIASACGEGWETEWNVTSIQDHPAFSEMVMEKPYGSGMADPLIFMDLVREGLGETTGV